MKKVILAALITISALQISASSKESNAPENAAQKSYFDTISGYYVKPSEMISKTRIFACNLANEVSEDGIPVAKIVHCACTEISKKLPTFAFSTPQEQLKKIADISSTSSEQNNPILKSDEALQKELDERTKLQAESFDRTDAANQR